MNEYCICDRCGTITKARTENQNFEIMVRGEQGAMESKILCERCRISLDRWWEGAKVRAYG